MSAHKKLDATLRAATVSGHPEELAGEDAAVAAFRAAAPVPHRRPLLARVLTVRTLVIGTAAVAVGVVTVVAGVLPLVPSPEPGTNPPAGTTSMTTEASVPAVPPLDGPNSRTGEQTGPAVTPPPAGTPTGTVPEPDGRGEDRPGHDKDKKDKDSSWPSGHAKTPGRPAQGAVTAVPPTGAEPPSKGG
jgi:hypothetical protein